MFFGVSILLACMINLIVISLISFLVQKLFQKIKFLYSYTKFPKDSNGSFLIADFLKIIFGSGNITELQDYPSEFHNFN